MMPLGVSWKCSRIIDSICGSRQLPGAEGVDVHRDRVGDADRVGELDLARSAMPAATMFLAT